MVKNWRSYFKLLNIPVYSKRNLNILELPLAQKIILLLKYLPQNMIFLTAVMKCCLKYCISTGFIFPPIDIAKLSVEAAEKKYDEPQFLSAGCCMIKQRNRPKIFLVQQLPAGLKEASAIMEKLIAKVPNVPCSSYSKI